MPRKKPPPPTTQTSLLFHLPPELRNEIYQTTAQNEPSISLSTRTGHNLYAPPLSLASRQLRSENKSIYLHFAPRHARRVNVHVQNFERRGAADAVDSLPPLASAQMGEKGEGEGKGRQFVVRVWLTNEWSRLHLRAFIRGHVLEHTDFTYTPLSRPEERSSEGHPSTSSNSDEPCDTLQLREPELREYAVDIHFSPLTFDTDFTLAALAKLDWCFRRGEQRVRWEGVREAFGKAFRRYGICVVQEERGRRKVARGKEVEGEAGAAVEAARRSMAGRKAKRRRGGEAGCIGE